MKNCDRCKYFFCRSEPGSPCEKCINEKWGGGFRFAGVPTLVRIWLHRAKLIIKR